MLYLHHLLIVNNVNLYICNLKKYDWLIIKSNKRVKVMRNWCCQNKSTSVINMRTNEDVKRGSSY